MVLLRTGKGTQGWRTGEGGPEAQPIGSEAEPSAGADVDVPSSSPIKMVLILPFVWGFVCLFLWFVFNSCYCCLLVAYFCLSYLSWVLFVCFFSFVFFPPFFFFSFFFFSFFAEPCGLRGLHTQARGRA